MGLELQQTETERFYDELFFRWQKITADCFWTLNGKLEWISKNAAHLNFIAGSRLP